MPANPYIAEALFRAQRPTFELGIDIRQEEEEEYRLEQERARAAETKKRRRDVKSGQGRWLGGVGGGILGFLVGGPAGAAVGAGIGSRLAQGAMVKTSPQAMKTFKRIGPGTYYVATDKARQDQFFHQQKEQDRYFKELMWANAGRDAMSAYSLSGGSSILDMILGRGGAGGGVPATAAQEIPYG